LLKRRRKTGRERILLEALGARGQLDLPRVAQIERELRRGRVAPRRLDLEAGQDDLLQPRRIVRLEPARRHRIAPQSSAHGANGLASPERPHAGGEEIK
jgi:hypothetical protein